MEGMKESGKYCVVTVGTTEFETLIQVLDCDTFYNALLEKGFVRLLMQIGRGKYIPTCGGEADADASSWSHKWQSKNVASGQNKSLQIEVCRYRSSLSDDLRAADLVVSHCGAGTCMETLEARRALLVVVINETLMHNHQVELADQLAADGYCVATRCDHLLALLSSDIDFSERRIGKKQLQPFSPGEPVRFARFLDALTANDS